MRIYGQVLVRPRTSSRLRRVMLERDVDDFVKKQLPQLVRRGWIPRKRGYFDPKSAPDVAFWFD